MIPRYFILGTGGNGNGALGGFGGGGGGGGSGHYNNAGKIIFLLFNTYY